MAGVHQLSRTDARRIAVRAQLLTAERPTDLIETVRRLSLLQLDPTRAVAPSAELVLWSRLGSAYAADELWDAVDEQRLIELRGTLRVAEDLALYRAEMAEWPGIGEVHALGSRRRATGSRPTTPAARDILDLLRTDGPLRAADLPDTCVEPWASSGWNNNKNLQMMLGFLVQKGEVAAAGGTGRHRLWDLAARVYPDDPSSRPRRRSCLRDQSSAGRARHRPVARARVPGRAARRRRGRGARRRGGGPRQWRVDPALLGQPFAGRAALLSPFDRLLHDRKRMADVFEFDYALEMYKPEAKRRWGYYALPILYGDRLVGKLDAKADRKAGVLAVAAIHQDVPFSRTMTGAVDREIEDLARWLDLELVLPG